MNSSQVTNAIADKIRRSLASPITTDDVLDPHKELFDVLASVGLDPSDCGGKVTFLGKDPILRRPWPLAMMAGVALVAKSIAVADLWRYRTGKGQDLTIALPQTPHPLLPFYALQSA